MRSGTGRWRRMIKVTMTVARARLLCVVGTEADSQRSWFTIFVILVKCTSRFVDSTCVRSDYLVSNC